MTGAELAALCYADELPPEVDYDCRRSVDSQPRHHCPVPGCDRTARWGNLTCSRCWWRIPPPARREIVSGFYRRESDRATYEAALSVAYMLAIEHAAPSCRTRAAQLTHQSGSDPASTRRMT